MVLVLYKLTNDIGILQTKLSHREGHEARRVGEEALPLDQHIKGRHGERQTGVEIRPGPMHHLLEVTLRHEVARWIVWHAVVTRPVVPSTVSYEVRQHGNALSHALGHGTHRHPTDTQTARGWCLCSHQAEMGLDGWDGEPM